MLAIRLTLFVTLASLGVEEGRVSTNSIRGIVTGRDGKPLAGSEILIASNPIAGLRPATLARTRSDVEGRFLIEIANEISICDRPTLWAVASHHAVASFELGHLSPNRQPTQLPLDESCPAVFVVAGPDGKPVAGAKVSPRTLARSSSTIPDDVAELASAKTDSEGRAEIVGFRPEELIGVEVDAEGYGRQLRDFRSSDGLADVADKGIKLIPVGRITGRVTCEDPRALSGLTIKVESTSEQGGLTVGFAEVATDTRGQFVVPAMASGIVTIRVLPRQGAPDLPARVIRGTLEAGQSLACEIPLRRGVRVSGVVLDSTDARPVPNVAVLVVPSGQAEASTAFTNTEGRYETIVPAGLVTHRVLSVPSPYLCPPDFIGPRPVQAPPAIARFELPEIRLARGGELRGSVVNDRDQPVAGAKVEAVWMHIEGRVRSPRSASTTTSHDGSFVLSPVAADSDVSLTASFDQSTTDRSILVRTTSSKRIVLRMTEPEGPAARGFVRSSDGRPIAGASVRLWSLRRSHGGSIEAVEPVTFAAGQELRTNEVGRFETPGPLRSDREYRVYASIRGSRPVQTPWRRLRHEAEPSFPDLIVEPAPRPITIQGKVIDREGKPIAGVKLFTTAEGPCRRSIASDSEGRFHLEECLGGPHFLFAEKVGFRFSGQSIEEASQSLEIRLCRTDEAPSSTMTTRSIPRVDPRIARRVLAPYAEKVLTDGDQTTRRKTLELLAKVDPARVLKLIEAGIINEPALADHLRHAVARSTFLDAGTERRALVELIRDPESRVSAALAVARELPESARGLKNEWIEKALEDSQLIREPSRRVVVGSRVASQLIDLGQRERATRILEATRGILESIPQSSAGGRCRVEFAESLARLNPTAALALTDSLVDPGLFDGSRVGIALRVAAERPDETMRVLNSLRDPRSVDAMLPSLCHALGSINPDGARKLLARSRPEDPCLVPYALGSLAMAVADRDRAAATGLLYEAFTKLEAVPAGFRDPAFPKNPATVAAALLPIVETVDASLVPEFFWRCVSFHASGHGSESKSEAILALLLARYDPKVAGRLLEPVIPRTFASGPTDMAPLIAALVILDPERAVRLVEELPEPSELTFHHLKNEARLELVAALLQSAPRCWDQATMRFLKLACPGTSDEN